MFDVWWQRVNKIHLSIVIQKFILFLCHAFIRSKNHLDTFTFYPTFTYISLCRQYKTLYYNSLLLFLCHISHISTPLQKTAQCWCFYVYSDIYIDLCFLHLILNVQFSFVIKGFEYVPQKLCTIFISVYPVSDDNLF